MNDRQQQLISLLCQRRSDSIQNLAMELGVCERTIRRDIEELTLTYPIETVRGRYGGGVRMADWYFQDRPKLTPKQTALLKRLASRNGEDLYPIIRKRAQEGPIYAPTLALRELHPEYADRIPSVAEQFTPDNHHDMVRFEIMKQFGYFVTESSEHSSEYYPWFIKKDHPELIDRFHIPLDEYPRRCRDQIARWKQQAEHLVHNENLTHTRSSEYAAGIIEALETGRTFGFAGNVLNTGLIDNLPFDACVEVSCMVNEGHLSPCHMGPLPNQLAALNRRQIEVHQLTVDAALTRKKEYIYQAAMLDPHAGSELTIDEIRSLVDDLIQAHGDWLPEYH